MLSTNMLTMNQSTTTTTSSQILSFVLNPLLSKYLPTLVLLTGLIGNLVSFVILFKICKIEISLKSMMMMNPVSLIRSRLRCGGTTTTTSATSPSRGTTATTSNRDSVIRINHPTNVNGLISLYLYLCLLTMTDLCVIVFGLGLGEWLVDMIDYNIKTRSATWCKMITYVTFVSSHMSSSLVVVSSFIRCVAFYNPLLTAQITNVRNFRYVSLAILAFYMLLNSHFMWTMKLVEYVDYDSSSTFMNHFNLNESNKSLDDRMLTKRTECRIDSSWFGDTLWPVVDKFLYCLLPFVLLLVCNSLILSNLRKKQPYNYLFYKSTLSSMYNQNNQRRIQHHHHQSGGVASRYEMAELLNNSKKSSSQMVVVNNSARIGGSAGSTTTTANNKQSSLKSLYRKNHVETRFTVLLLSLSFSFLVLTLPIVVLMVLVRPIMNRVDGMQDVWEANEALEVLYLFQKLAQLFMYTNHSINFFIFYLVSVRFRKCLQSWLVGKRAPYSRIKMYFKYSNNNNKQSSAAECNALTKYRLRKRCSLMYA